MNRFRAVIPAVVTAGCLLFSGVSLWAAQGRINVGTVTKYTGGPASLVEIKAAQLFLSTLETQVAAEAIKFEDLDYIDRSSVDQIFRELNLSSDAAFDATSGALRGLLGRLDYLIVIDASSGHVARLRALDNATGAVRSVAMCKQARVSPVSSDGDEPCVRNFLSQLHPFVKRAFLDKQQKAGDAAHALEDAERDRAQTLALKSEMDASLARLAAANSFWQRIRSSVPNRQLRPEIETALSAANNDGKGCQDSFANSRPDSLYDGIKSLTHNLDVLDSYK